MITVVFGIRVVDEPLDVPKGGEIVMRGNNVMKRYYNNPVGTQRAFSGGCLNRGDIAV
jgi:long-subunit acyl-CoA synthetase (AMP-forming)